MDHGRTGAGKSVNKGETSECVPVASDPPVKVIASALHLTPRLSFCPPTPPTRPLWPHRHLLPDFLLLSLVLFSSLWSSSSKYY